MKNSIFLILVLIACDYAIASEIPKKAEEKNFTNYYAPKGLEIDVGEDAAKGTLSIGHLSNANLYSLSLEGDLKDKSSELLDLDGITSDTKLKFGWTKLFIDLPTINLPKTVKFDKQAVEFARFQRASCERLNKLIVQLGETPVDECQDEKKLEGELVNEIFLTEEALAVSRLAHNISIKCKKYLDKPYAARLDIAEDCANADKLKQKLTRTNQEIVNYPLKNYDFLNFSVAYLQSEFEWYEESKISSDSPTNSSEEDGFELIGSYGRVYSNTLVRWEAGAKFQKGHANAKANVERSLCFPYKTDTDIMECVEGYLLPPVEKEIWTPFITVSKQFSNNDFLKAISVTLKHSFEDAEQQDGSISELDRWAVEVPIYVISAPDDKLSAGAKLSWVSETRKNEDPIKFSVFISTPISIF